MKWLAWLVKLAISVSLTAVICTAATLYTVNAYVNLLLDQFQIQRPAQTSLQWSDFLGYVGKQWGAAGQSKSDSLQNNPLSVTANPQPEQDSSETIQPAPGNNPQEEPLPPKDAVAVWNQSGLTEFGQEASEQQMVISMEQFARKKDQLTDAQKLKVFSVISRMPESDIQQISLLMEDGITAAEWKELEKLLQQHLTAEEFEELRQLMELE